MSRTLKLFALLGVSMSWVWLGASVGQAQVTGEVRDGLISLFANQPVQAAGIDFQSPAGRLIPVPDPPGARPFTFFLSNTPNQITWGNLGSTVTLDGALNTQAGYAGDPTGDLSAFWGNGPDPIAIPISLVGDPIPPIEPPVQPPTPVMPPDSSGALVTGEVRDGAVVFIAHEPVAAVGLDLQSRSARLIPIPEPTDASPFEFLLANNRRQIAWGNLGSTVTLDGTLTTGARYAGNPTNDLTAVWGRGTEEVSIPISLAAPSEPPPRPDPPILNPMIPFEVSPHPSGSPIFAEVREGTVLLFASEPVNAVVGLDFQSAAGRLVPVSDPPGATPFAFFLSNTPNQITWSNLEPTATLDGAFNTQAGYFGDPTGDLLAFWGDDEFTPIAIPVALSSEPIPPNLGLPVELPPLEPPIVVQPPIPEVPEVPPTVDPPAERPPIASGTVTGELRDGKIVVIASSPVGAAGLDFQSDAGLLVPVPDPPGASPFTFFLANTPHQITWGNLGSNVTIDGELATEAGYTGDPASGDLRTFWGNGATAVEFATTREGETVSPPVVVDPPVIEPPTEDPPVIEPPVIEPPVIEPPVVEPPTVNPPRPNIGRLTGVVNEDGFVVLTASEPIEAAGIDLQSAAGNLVPVSDEIGSRPFTFFLSNTSNQITWGNLGSTVTLEGDFVTGAGYNGEPEGDLLGFWGNGASPVAFPITAANAAADPVVPGNEVIPEPTGMLLGWFALLGLLAVRRPRRRLY